MKTRELKLKRFRSLVKVDSYKLLSKMWNEDFMLRDLYDEILITNNIRLFVMAELVDNPNKKLIKVF